MRKLIHMPVRTTRIAEQTIVRLDFSRALFCRVLVPTLCFAACVPSARSEDGAEGLSVPTGAAINLLQEWPEIAEAPQAKIGTLEFRMRPDADAVARPRSFILILSNRGGSDAASVSLTLNHGAVRANVLGTLLDSKTKLIPDEWVHVALTIHQKTVNKQARLWINGNLAAEQLVLEYWPRSFEVAEMLCDHWNLGRVFSGQIGDVRISKSVRYTRPFDPPRRLPEDADCVLYLDRRKLTLR